MCTCQALTGCGATYITLARAGGAELKAVADDVGHAEIPMSDSFRCLLIAGDT